MKLATALLALALLAPPTAAQRTAPHRPPPSLGSWEPPFDHDLAGFAPPPRPGRFNAVHMSLIPRGPQRGSVLVWDVEGPQTSEAWDQRWSIVDVAQPGKPVFLNAELTLPIQLGDFFCAGHAWTSDGDLFVAGGTERYSIEGRLHGGIEGGKLVYVWKPMPGPTGRWERMPDLAYGRWYPTVVLLDTGELIVAGGLEEEELPLRTDYEVYAPGGNAIQLGRRYVARGPFPGPALPASEFGLYPRIHQLSSGEQFVSGMGGATARMNHALAAGVWQTLDDGSWSHCEYHSSVLLQGTAAGSDLVMNIGGEAFDGVGSLGVVDTVEVCLPAAPGAPEWDWTPRRHLGEARTRANAVLLPDRSVLVVGGRTSAHGAPETAPSSAELFDGTRWHPVAPGLSPRGYHSTAVLLPSGKVLTGGGDSATWDYQVFVPPYLERPERRPVIASAPEALAYSLPSPPSPVEHELALEPLHPGETVGHVALLAPGSVTHHFDASQRYVELAITDATATGVRFLGPTGRGQAPPGTYMLFVVTTSGIPSVAHWVDVR